MPFMSLCAALVPMLVAGAEFVDLAVVETTLPSICASPLHRDGLRLTVYVHSWGWEVDGSDPALYGRAFADDPEQLSEVLADVKGRHPHRGDIVLVVAPDVPFEDVVRTMDATRSFEGHELFPWPVLAGGILE